MQEFPPLQEMGAVDCTQTRGKRLAANWANLPVELLLLILNHLTNISHYIRFRSVCVSWRFAAGLTDLKQQLPWLVAPFPTDGCANTLSFFSLSDNRRLCALHIQEAQGYWIYGTGHGWLLMIGRPTSLPASSRRAASLLNPITRVHISLPALPTGLYLTYGLQKFVLCSDPASPRPGQIMVAVWTSKRIAFFRQGDNAWNIVNYWDEPLADIVLFDEKLYVIGCRGGFAVVRENNLKLSRFNQPEPPRPWSAILGIMEAAGDLLLLTRHAKLITVFKLHTRGKGECKLHWEWLKVDTIDMTFFRRSKSRIRSICAQGLPDCGGYRIYLAYASSELLSTGVTALVQVVDIMPGVRVIEQPSFEVPVWSSPKCWDPSALTWMVPSLH